MDCRFFYAISLTAWIALASSLQGENEPPVRRTEESHRFWAYKPITNPTVPEVGDAHWPRTPVDHFILAKLQDAGLKPNPPADKHTLIRRATFDLIGLPPTPEEVEAFVTDDSSEAFAKVVERLLASPHYGERWGRHWLDVARYADTAGETADYPVPEAYRYRNYVIDAFNRDTPYDQFIREQIAGDILALRATARGGLDRTRYEELITATGFLAVSRRFGFDTEKYEHLTIQDTIDTLGQALQGLSLGCARCHDHKYDPVSTEDYYGLYGFFASTRYAFAGSERLQKVRSGVPLIPPPEAAQRWREWDRQAGDLEAEIARLTARHAELEAKAGVTNKTKLPPLDKVTIRPLNEIDGDFELQAPPQGGSLGLPANPWRFTGGVRIDKAAQSPFHHIRQAGGSGASFPGGEGDHSLGQGLVPSYRNSASHRLYVASDFRVVSKTNSPAPGSYRFRLGIGADQSPALEIFLSGDGFFVRNQSRVESIRPLVTNVWQHLQLELDLRGRTYRGMVGAPGDVTSFADKAFALDWDGRIDYLQFDANGHIAGPRPSLHLDNLMISETPLQPLPDSAPGAPISKDSGLDLRELGKRIEACQKRYAELLEAGPFPMAYAVWEGTPHDVCVQKRGEPSQPGPIVRRRFPEVLGGDTLPFGAEGSGRLELANWLARPENPLTARVMVNRIWQHHFGHGLVATENDFGVRGQPPSHPELLDYLARRFIAGGWSIKAMHRLILRSQTYQQASDSNSQAIMADSNNRLLSRFPRRRLDAESIRDAILALSGSLELGASGPHPFPKTQKLSFTQHAPFRAVYENKRRTVYLMTQRLKRHPLLALFDGPDPNASTAKRSDTTVPTQALFMMNDSFVHEQSLGFGRRLMKLDLSDPGRVSRAFEFAFARPPSPAEQEDALEFLRLYREKLGAVEGAEADRERQAWAAFARTLFARNEFVYTD